MSVHGRSWAIVTVSRYCRCFVHNVSAAVGGPTRGADRRRADLIPWSSGRREPGSATDGTRLHGPRKSTLSSSVGSRVRPNDVRSSLAPIEVRVRQIRIVEVGVREDRPPERAVVGRSTSTVCGLVPLVVPYHLLLRV